MGLRCCCLGICGGANGCGSEMADFPAASAPSGDNDNDKDDNDDGGGGGNRLTQRGRGCSRTNPCGKLALHKTMIASLIGFLLNADCVLCRQM